MRVKTEENFIIANGGNQARVDINYVDHSKKTYPDYIDVVIKDDNGEGSEVARLTVDLTTEGLTHLKAFALTIHEVIALLESKL